MEGLQTLHSTSATFCSWSALTVHFLVGAHPLPTLNLEASGFPFWTLVSPLRTRLQNSLGSQSCSSMSRNRDYAMPSDSQTGLVWIKAMVERSSLPSTLLSAFAPIPLSFSCRPLQLHSPHLVIFLRQNRLLREEHRLQQPAYSQSWTSRAVCLDPLQHSHLCASVLADATRTSTASQSSLEMLEINGRYIVISVTSVSWCYLV